MERCCLSLLAHLTLHSVIRIGEELGVQLVRLRREHIDLASKGNIDQLVEQVKAIPGCSIHGSTECGPWSAWQRLSGAKNPRLSNILREKRRESVSVTHSFIRVANHVLDNGGFVLFEWPRYCSGCVNLWRLGSLKGNCCQPLHCWNHCQGQQARKEALEVCDKQ